MKVFNQYAKYYDLLYQDKDYNSEAKYIESLIRKYSNTDREILELGCGSGRHALLLAEKGYSVTGIDQSDEMLNLAKENLEKASPEAAQNFQQVQGNLCNLDLNQEFDIVISLFHVFSYVTKNGDLASAFNTVNKHLKSGGLFIFDCWYGPCVLSEKPSTCIKRMQDKELSVTRLVESELHVGKNTVEVNYEIFINELSTDENYKLNETHYMRYFFQPEIEERLENNNMELVSSEEWMTGKDLDCSTWGATFIAKKK